jgi:hypothetical protein
MTSVFKNVNGFNLKVPYNSMSGSTDEFDNATTKREWIEFTKKQNELPTVKLRTMVLYYRNDGEDTVWSSYTGTIPTTIDNGVDVSGGNYRFYNNNTSVGDVGAQMGSIWGFPLFDLSGSAATHWPRFKSCIGSGADMSGNQKMLVDLTEQRNIIVLDCSGLGAGIFNEISGNITDLDDAFYITLRIKSSEENVIDDILDLAPGYGQSCCWNLYNGATPDKNRWATLVQYEYECDIIGPNGMLDFTLDYFMYNVAGTGNIIKQGTQKLVRINKGEFSTNLSNNAIEENKYTDQIIYFLTGCGNVDENRMEINQILNKLSYDVDTSRNKMLNYNDTFSVVKLIGGWYKYGISNNKGYYGSIGNAILTDSSYNITEGWKNDISLNSSSSINVWPGDLLSSKSYDLNNILWCSLRSARRIKVRNFKNSSKGDNNRYITNFIDVIDDTTNDITGGGYGRDPNTIDLPRASVNPYYHSSSNTDTVSIDGFDTKKDVNYLSALDTPLTKEEVKGFRVYYKLLIPPIGDEEYKISYTFGRDISSVATFFRYPDMDGECGDASNNLYADRNFETITLRWDDYVDSSGNMPIQSILFTDIASGFNKTNATFDISSSVLDNVNSEDYDISFNIFQTHFFSRNDSTGVVDTDRNEVPYTIKNFVNSDISQNIDISYVPVGYIPYRYFNHKIPITPNGVPSIQMNSLFFDAGNTQFFESISEKLKYNSNKYFMKGSGLYKENANIIDPSGISTITEKTIHINASPDSYVIKGVSDVSTDGQEIAILESSITRDITEHTAILYYYNTQNIKKRIKVLRPLSNSLKLGTNFIPDYWRLPDKINTVRKNSATKYQYLSKWENQIQISMVFDILSLSLKLGASGKDITHMLINTYQNSSQHCALDKDGDLDSDLDDEKNIIFGVNGWSGTRPEDTLNKRPIIVQLIASSDGPFGPNGIKFIGNQTNGVGGINVPYKDKPGSTFSVTSTLPNTMRKGNNTNLTLPETAYNGIFDINIKAWDSGTPQNQAFRNIVMSPSPLKVLLVDISGAIQSNPGQQKMLSDDNRTITIIWSSFTFSNYPFWNTPNGRKSDIYWTVVRYNIATGKSDIILNDKTIPISNEKYQFSDSNIRIYDKYNYTVSGIFKWTGITSLVPGATVPTISVDGFKTADCFICKFNRFPYGRYNTTSTNLKLYRPLLINTSEGQEDQFGNKTCGGGCSDPSRPGLNLFGGGSRISSSNNIYSNVTNQISKKQTYVILAKSKNRPFR